MMVANRHFTTLAILFSVAIFPAFANPSTLASRGPDGKRAAKLAPSRAGISLLSLTTKERADITALPAPKPAENEIFVHLTKKVGREPEIPSHPSNVSALESWFFSRQTDSHDPAVVYPLLYENLLVTRGLFNSPNIERQRLGLVFARYSETAARLNLQDYVLTAHICEAFLVPHLDIAYPENGHTVSRRQILEDTYNAYEGTGDSPHELTTLLFLLRYADSENTRNWARLMLAQSYEQAGNYGQAVAFLKTTKPQDKAWLDRLQQEDKAQQAKARPSTNR